MPNKDVTQKIIILAQLLLLVIVLFVPLKIVITSAGYSKPGQDLDPGDISEFHATGGYKIDTNTILNSIKNKQTPPFLPETESTADSDLSTGVAWSQKNYMKVVDALFEFVWKESLDKNWSIHKMSFKADCDKASAGFEYATFVFYQLIFRQGELRYNARALEISPHYERVSWGGDSTFYRPILGAYVIDRDKLRISADDVIKIAEANGGEVLRQSIQDKCNVQLYFSGDWEVDYVGTNGLPILNMDIDANTGKVVEITQTH